MATESGRDGKVLIGATPIADITAWEFNPEVETSRYASSSTNKFKRTIPGTKMGSGSIEYKWSNSVASPITEGTVVTLLLYLNVTLFFSVPAVIKSNRLRVDIDTGAVTGVTATFETDGEWTRPAGL